MHVLPRVRIRSPFTTERSGPLHALRSLAPRTITHEGVVLEQHIREGRFQRSLALVAALSSLLSGLEVTYEHYRGSYSRRVMWTPVAISGALTCVGVAAVFSRWAARVLLPITGLLTMADGLAGLYFHVRGVARKPGGWRIPAMNVVMGPPVFAPLLFGLSGYLALIAALLRREDDPGRFTLPGFRRPSQAAGPAALRELTGEWAVMRQHVREGRFQRHLAVAAGLSALLSGLEALYSHYKNGFMHRRLEWSPVIVSLALFGAGIATVPSKVAGRILLPLVSAGAILDGAIGFYMHGRACLERPGGARLPLYNLIYGPPIFAPLLLAASGAMGLLASLLRRA